MNTGFFYCFLNIIIVKATAAKSFKLSAATSEWAGWMGSMGFIGSK